MGSPDHGLSHNELSGRDVFPEKGCLAGKVAIITGASRGIGLAIVRRFLEESPAGIVVSARQSSVERLNDVIEEIDAAGSTGISVPGDIREPETARRLVNETQERFGPNRVDILVNNAGITRDGLLIRMSDENWDDVLRTDLYGPFYLMRAAVDPMRKQRCGSIVNITSVVGMIGNPGQTNYSAAKAGLIGLTLAAAAELAPWNIRVNAVAPGLVETEMTAGLSEKQLVKIRDNTPIRRPVTVEGVAEAVLYLASDRSVDVTGEVLKVDGGLVRG